MKQIERRASSPPAAQQTAPTGSALPAACPARRRICSITSGPISDTSARPSRADHPMTSPHSDRPRADRSTRSDRSRRWLRRRPARHRPADRSGRQHAAAASDRSATSAASTHKPLRSIRPSYRTRSGVNALLDQVHRDDLATRDHGLADCERPLTDRTRASRSIECQCHVEAVGTYCSPAEPRSSPRAARGSS